MAVMARESWSDGRLDDLDSRVNRLERIEEQRLEERDTRFEAEIRILTIVIIGLSWSPTAYFVSRAVFG